MKNILKFAFCLFFIVGLVPNLMGCNKLVKQIAKFVKPVAAVEEPVAAVEEPVAAVEEPVAAVEEPVAAVEEPVAQITLDHRHQIDEAKKVRQTLSSEEANSRNFAFTEAKRVTIARALYNQGIKDQQLPGGANIQSVEDILAVLSPLNDDMTNITDKKSAAYLRKDAYRAGFTDLYKGEAQLQRLLQYYNGLGLSTDDKAFSVKEEEPSKIRLGEMTTKYWHNWTGDDKLGGFINREVESHLLNKTNYKLSDEDAATSEDALKRGIFYKLDKDENGTIVKKTRVEDPKAGSINDMIGLAYSPESIFFNEQDRIALMRIIEKDYNNRIDENGLRVFNDRDPGTLEIKKILKEGSALRNYYEARDKILNTSGVYGKVTDDAVKSLKGNIAALQNEDPSLAVGNEDAIKTMLGYLKDFLPQEQSARWTGNNFGELWGKEKIIAGMTGLLPENQKDYGTEEKAKKGKPAAEI